MYFIVRSYMALELMLSPGALLMLLYFLRECFGVVDM